MQVSPELYGDNYPRFFTYWTVRSITTFFKLFAWIIYLISWGKIIYWIENLEKQTDAYQATGCYNLLCSGFVQTNNKIAIGAAISPRSSYNGRQFDIGLMIWKVSLHFLPFISTLLTIFLSYSIHKEGLKNPENLKYLTLCTYLMILVKQHETNTHSIICWKLW